MIHSSGKRLGVMKNKVMLSVKNALEIQGLPSGKDAQTSTFQSVMTGGVTSCPSLSGQRGISPPHSSPPADSIFFALVSWVGDLSHSRSRLDRLCQAPRSPRGPCVAPLVSPPLLHTPAEVCCKVAPCSDFGQQPDMIHSPRLSQRAGGRGERCLGSSEASVFVFARWCRYCVGRSEQHHAHESASHSARGPVSAWLEGQGQCEHMTLSLCLLFCEMGLLLVPTS